MAKQVIYRRGTTAEHANFVGANGEITVDTVKHVVIVHDGVTAGGFPLANASTITANISALTANAANQAAAITVLQANAATQSANIATLFANAAAQQANITAFTLASNSTVIFANIAGVQANVTAANVQIGLLFGNATIQSEAIVLANANIIALQSSITAANVAIAGIVTGTTFVTQTAFANNLTAVNSAISTQGTTFATNVAVAGVTANVTAANLAISALQANIAAANVAINNIALSPSLIDSIAQAVGPIVTDGAFYSNSNLAGYLSGNITVGNIKSTQYNFANGVNILSAVTTNIAAANAAIQSLSANIGTLVAGAPGALDTLIELGNALGNNASFSATMVTWLSNITSNITAANGSITTLQTQVYANANVATYLPTYTGNIAGNIVKSGYTWTFSNTGTTTFPTGVTLSNARGANTVNFTTAIDKSFQIETQTSTTGRLWSFGTDGNLTLPQFANINFSNGVSILANITSTSMTANTFNVTDGGAIGRYTGGGFVGIKMVANAALGQNVAIMGTGNISFPVLNYVATTLYGATIGTWGGDWNFSSNTGALTFPSQGQGSTLGESLEIVTVTLDQFTDGGFPGTQVFTKVSDTLYELSPGGPYMTLISGIWRLKVSTSTYYDSTDLGTWGTVAGGLPAPVGTLGTVASMNLTVGGNVWGFSTNGNLKFPTNNLTITPKSVAFSNAAVVSSANNLITLSTGVNGGTSSLWVEDYANIGTSNIAAVYANPTVGSKTVRIAVGQNGGAGPKLWDFGTNGTLTTPGNITLPNGAVLKDAAYDAVAFGYQAGETSQAGGAVAVGKQAGKTSQGAYGVAIGQLTGFSGQGVYAVAIGYSAGSSTQGNVAVAIGQTAGQISQGIEAVAVGKNAGKTSQGSQAVAVGLSAGQTNQGLYAVAIGETAGNTSQGLYGVAVGQEAGSNTQGYGAVAVGSSAGYDTQGTQAVAIGIYAGYITQSANAVAVGQMAGHTSQGTKSVAIGNESGKTSQGTQSVAVGPDAGRTSQGDYSVAVGLSAGYTTQGIYSVAVGFQSGFTGQGNSAVAIGPMAGFTNQANNSIILNATGAVLNQTTANTFTVAPVRNDVTNVSSVMFYNTTSKEITYGNTISIAGNITAGNVSARNFVGAIQAQVGSSFAYSLNAFGAGSDTGGVFLPADINSNAVVAGYTIVSSAGVTLTVTSASFVAGTPNFVTVATTPTASSFLYPATVYSANYSPALPTSTITVGNATVSSTITAGNIKVNGTGSALSQVAVYGSASANASLGMYNSIVDAGAQIYLGDNNFNTSTKWNSAPGIGATYDSSYGGLAGALGLYTYAGNDNSRTLRVTVDAQQGGVQVHSNAASYSTTTGALKIGGGVGVVGNLFVGGNITQQSAYYETYSNVTNSGGNLTCNFVNGTTFYATLTANVTVNFTNVVATAGRVTGATLIVDQGATAYRVANLQINSGGIQTIKYAGATPGVGTASNTDVMSFSLISLDGTNWRVLGQISNYG